MPRKSGTTRVWSSTKTAATLAHMSPVSPKPCSMTTAGPLPPTRAWIVAPLALILRFRKLGGNAPTFADDGTAGPPIELPQCIASGGISQACKEALQPNRPQQPTFEMPDRRRRANGLVWDDCQDNRKQPSGRRPRCRKRTVRLMENHLVHRPARAPAKFHADTRKLGDDEAAPQVGDELVGWLTPGR